MPKPFPTEDCGTNLVLYVSRRVLNRTKQRNDSVHAADGMRVRKDRSTLPRFVTAQTFLQEGPQDTVVACGTRNKNYAPFLTGGQLLYVPWFYEFSTRYASSAGIFEPPLSTRPPPIFMVSERQINMKRHIFVAIATTACAAIAASAAEKVDFLLDVKPILESACIGCHGPE